MEILNEKRWIRIRLVTEIYGIKKTKLYQILNSGEIKSKLISSKIRLVSVSSIEEHINSK